MAGVMVGPCNVWEAVVTSLNFVDVSQVKPMNGFSLNFRKCLPGPVFTKILILRIVLFLEFFLEFCSFLRIILRIRIFKIWNVLKSSQFGPI